MIWSLLLQQVFNLREVIGDLPANRGKRDHPSPLRVLNDLDPEQAGAGELCLSYSQVTVNL